jgi:predicted GNAT family acetyltransferase
MKRYRRMGQAGLGEWFGAFLDGRLVADLGVFTDGSVGRFQSVGTHPGYRRRGICGTLVHQASRHAFERIGVETLVMVADEHYFAAKIYESVGFQRTEKQVGLDWWEKEAG